MRFRELDKAVKSAGWYEVAKVGSHHQYKHPTMTGKITIPEHAGRDVSPTLAKKIMKQAGL